MKSKCTYGGCKRIAIKHGRCEKHKPTYQRKQYEHHAQGRTKNIYTSARWQRLREQKRAQQPLCEICDSLGTTTGADVVDHWIEIRDCNKPECMWSLDNLVSMCHRCHAQKTKLIARLRATNKAKLKWYLKELKPTPISESHSLIIDSLSP